MFTGVLDYVLLCACIVPLKIIDDLLVIQNFALRSFLKINDTLDQNMVELHDVANVKLLRHRMIFQ